MTTTPSLVSPGTKPKRTPRGADAGCPPRPSGSTPRAARTVGRTPGGNEWDGRRANGNDESAEGGQGRLDGSVDGFARMAPVGMFPQGASPYGVLDMAGNVWEWVTDWHGPYPSESQTDYEGPATGVYKVIRGGSAYVGRLNLRTIHRAYRVPTRRSHDMGFRCASDYPPVAAGAVPTDVEQAVREARRQADTTAVDSSAQQAPATQAEQ